MSNSRYDQSHPGAAKDGYTPPRTPPPPPKPKEQGSVPAKKN